MLPGRTGPKGDAAEEPVAEMDRLGNEIAKLSAHLDAAATARLLDLIREFDARGGWANGFRSCACGIGSWGARVRVWLLNETASR